MADEFVMGDAPGPIYEAGRRSVLDSEELKALRELAEAVAMHEDCFRDKCWSVIDALHRYRSLAGHE